MTRLMAMTVMLLLVGCKSGSGENGATGDKGPTGDKGATGDKGPTGDQGAPGTSGSAAGRRLVWADATGALVGPYDQFPVYVDDGGVLWSVDIDTGLVHEKTGVYLRYHSSVDCSGVGCFRNTPVARWAFKHADGYFVRNDTINDTRTDAGSQMYREVGADGGLSQDCQPSTNDWVVCVPETALIPVSLPTVQFTGPLHVEAR